MLRQFLKLLLLSTLFPFFLASAPPAASADAPSTKTVRIKPAKIAGKWRIAWDVRAGTVRAVLDLKQKADQVTGTFEEYGKTYSLTGSLQGQAITFNVPFGGPVPYTIEFKGTVDHNKKMTGTSGLKGGGRVFLGHANEIQEPERPWIATKGLKHTLDHTGKPPKEDDDD
jgi:hypothetical protein